MIVEKTLSEFRALEVYRRCQTMSLEIAYTDNTHLCDEQWCRLLRIEIDRAKRGSTREDAEPYFNICVDIDQTIVTKEPHNKAINDLISLCFNRIGIIEPEYHNEMFTKMRSLCASDGVMLIPDTNVLYNGSLYWLLNILRNSTVWLLPFVMSLTQIQERDAKAQKSRR
jgi:hypothetical protein